MQNTRLNTLVDSFLGQFESWLQNPWRRISLIIIGLLFGNLLATVIATTAGQTAELDAIVAFILVALTELVSWLVYRINRVTQTSERFLRRPLLTEILNSVKLGLVYGMFVEAFKIGS